MRCRQTLPLWALAALVSLTAGCSYIHFGRIDKLRGDSALAAENSDLRIQKKLLQEELSIAARERKALQKAIDDASSAGKPATNELVEQLAAAHHELETLRSDYARLDAERKELAAKSERRLFQPKEPSENHQITGLKEQLSTTETKLADALRTYSTLQAENQQLRTAIEQAHTQNAQLSAKVQELTASNNDAQAALAQLNVSLLAQKEARAEAEKSALTLQTKVDELARAPTPVLPAASPETSAPATATPPPPPAPQLSLAAARESSAESARELTSSGKLPLAGNSALVVLSARADKPATPKPAPQPTATKAPRTYTVRDGDSLEKIAEQVYGRRDRWILLYTANNTLLSDGKPLKAGMTLQVPENE